MENRNENGRGIFYGVIGVATLVVAMIGATFAYFSASANTANNALSATAANITLAMGTPVTTGLKSNIIPVDETKQGFATGGYIGVGPSDTDDADTLNNPKNKNCVDDDGNEFCSVYTFTLKNPSTTTAQKVYAKMDVVTNTFQENTTSNASKQECKTGATTMYCNKSNFAFAIFKGTAEDVDGTISGLTGGWAVDDAATTTYYGPTAATGVEMFSATNLDMTSNSTTGTTGQTVTQAPTGDPILTNNVAGTAVLGKKGDMVVGRTPVPALSAGTTHTFRLAALDQTLKPGGEVTYTVLMWLHENNEDQGNDETKAFAGGITFSTALGGNGVTAILSATGQ